jgi:hypothetical protein
MSEFNKFSLVKPTVDTPFHIDFEWWKQHDSNWKVYLLGCLCSMHQIALKNLDSNAQIDWIDEETAEVQTIDGLQHILITHCAKQPGFISDHTALVDTVFRVLLANGNVPLSSHELSTLTGRPAETILRTFAGTTTYKGVRPCHK